MPDPFLVGNFLHRLDLHFGAGEMLDPTLKHAAKRIQTLAGKGQIKHHVVAFVALPVFVCVLRLHDIQFDLARLDATFDQ